MRAGEAVFVDLDRTLLRSASGPVLHRALEDEGVVAPGRHLPGEGALYGLYERFGETALFMGVARATAAAMRGSDAAATRAAGKRAVDGLLPLVQPFAPEVLATHRKEGRTLVLATTSPEDLVRPLAEAMGFDDVVATRYQVRDGRYTGRIEGRFAWGPGKRAAVAAWADQHGVDLGSSHAYSDSIYDLPLLTAVGHPHPLNADARLAAVAVVRRWTLEYWDRPPGVPSILGWEPYHLARVFFRPEAFPYARFDVAGVENVPSSGPVVIVANHRSYFDVAAVGLVAARLRRPVRFLGKRELFDAPVIGTLASALGGIPVDRENDPGRSMAEAESALRAGEVVIVLPQGTIPRGEAFFDPVLVGRTGAARLARSTGAPVVPIGLWGTEQVWPRSSRFPDVTGVAHPPLVRVRVGRPLEVASDDAVAETAALMERIVDLLPPEARQAHEPTADELARTQPPA